MEGGIVCECESHMRGSIAGSLSATDDAVAAAGPPGRRDEGCWSEVMLQLQKTMDMNSTVTDERNKDDVGRKMKDAASEEEREEEEEE